MDLSPRGDSWDFDQSRTLGEAESGCRSPGSRGVDLHNRCAEGAGTIVSITDAVVGIRIAYIIRDIDRERGDVGRVARPDREGRREEGREHCDEERETPERN
jgi:hypothetical protein